MVDVPVYARVECADGLDGQSVGVIIDPMTWQVTHFLIQESRLSHTEYLVPACSVVDTTPDLVRLRCSKSELATMQPFIESEHNRIDCSTFDGGAYWVRPEWPDVILATILMSMRHKHIPPCELIVRWGARVKATDGQVGQVDEFLVDPMTRRVTHLVLQKRDPWGQKDVMVPLAEIERAGEDTVYLKLDRDAVESLPAISVGRWHGRKAA